MERHCFLPADDVLLGSRVKVYFQLAEQLNLLHSFVTNDELLVGAVKPARIERVLEFIKRVIN